MRPRITKEQKAAMEIAESWAEDLAKNHPEIADDYSNHMTHMEIAKKYNLINAAPSEGMVRYVVHRTLALLMTPEEMEKLAYEHRSEHGRKTRDEGKGIFGRDAKKRKEDSVVALEARGRMPWYPLDLAYFVELCQYERFQYGPGKHEGKPDYHKISLELEAATGVLRTPHSLGNARNRAKANKQAAQSA